MSQFKRINYAYMLYETVRNFFAINSSGQLTILYRYLLCIIYPLQNEWNAFETFRDREKIIAMCKWQHGQLVNVLNYFFDNVQKRITITEAFNNTVYVPNITLESTVFVPNITDESTVFVPNINSPFLFLSFTTFHVPASIYANQTEFKNVVDQINIGVPYNIVSL